MKYRCPVCERAELTFQRTYKDDMSAVTCPSCGSGALVGFSDNTDEVYLDFLAAHDDGLVLVGGGGGSGGESVGSGGGDGKGADGGGGDDNSDGDGEGGDGGGKDLAKDGTVHDGLLVDGGMVRDRREIDAMVREAGVGRLDPVTRDALYSKSDYVSHYEVIRGPEPRMGARVGDVVCKEIARHMAGMGIDRLYEFQEEAVRRVLDGGDTVIEAPTASGKTVAFVVPVVVEIARGMAAAAAAGGAGVGGGRGVLALFVYPTKALARDQFSKIEGFARCVGARAAVFDGDVGEIGRRNVIGNPPQIIVTNFDVLHHHMWRGTRFAALLATVRFLVVDEVHAYSGIFGSNVHYIIKRLERLCGRGGGGGIRFVAASATLDNAAEFCGSLFGRPVGVVRGSGRRGETDFAIVFPSLRRQRALMVQLAKGLTARGHKTLVFSNSHRGAEMLAMQARRQGVGIKVHRAGLTAAYRQRVEKEFRGDGLDAISCTPTLELGIDVGGVDGVISAVVPVNRLFQRIGRAARGGQRGFAFLALGNDPISQYYRNHPRDYLEDVERLYIDPQNPFVEEMQVAAMACDRPLSAGEAAGLGGVVARLVEDGVLAAEGAGGTKRYVPDRGEASGMLGKYSIRGMGGSVSIFRGSRRVGDRVLPVALEELHKDAVYFMGGVRYMVSRLAYPEAGRAEIAEIPRDYPYYTRALTQEWPTVEEVYERRRVGEGGMEIAFCRLHVKKVVYGYANIEVGQDAAQGARVELEEPLEYDFVTKGVAFCAPRPSDEAGVVGEVDRVVASGYHAAEHVVIEGSNMITGGASQDLGGISMGTSGMIYVYDGAVGGSGASRALYDRFEGAAGRGLSILSECPCTGESGCPRCTYSYRCGNNNEYLHKLAAREVFRRIVGGERTDVIEPSEGDRPFV